jgi:hypothetical protein
LRKNQIFFLKILSSKQSTLLVSVILFSFFLFKKNFAFLKEICNQYCMGEGIAVRHYYAQGTEGLLSAQLCPHVGDEAFPM